MTKAGTFSDGAVVNRVNYLHRDQLQSVRLITNAAGEKTQDAIYHPFGEKKNFTHDLTLTEESKGFIPSRDIAAQYHAGQRASATTATAGCSAVELIPQINS